MTKIKIGVLGAFRGRSMIRFCETTDDVVLTAVCDKSQRVIKQIQDEFNDDAITYYEDFEEFLNHDMDAVVLANYATQHAPFAIRCLERGFHVYSEVLPCQNMREAVFLCEAVEKSGKIYAYGENYAFMPAPREMRRLYREGKIGEFEYGEGEYIHNCEPMWAKITYGDRNHWRNDMYANFYCTHSIGAVMHITGLRPVRVTGYESKMTERKLRNGAKGGLFGIEMIEMENGGIYKSIHGDLYKNSVWFCIYGSKGRMESAREDAEMKDASRIYINADEYSGEYPRPERIETYLPEIPEECKGYAHGGSDYIMMKNFVDKIRGDENADIIDVYEALNMFLPGLLAYRSVLNGGIPIDIPDMRNKDEREKYRNDTACVSPDAAGDQLIPSFSLGTPEIDDCVYETVRQKWLRELEEAKKLAEEKKKQGK